jgi:glycosyltransferase involved in cell wall biosynthesis
VKIDVVPEGPGLEAAADPTPEAELRARLGVGDAPLVLSLSARRRHKNLHRLVEAMVRVPDAVLVLPGYPAPLDDDLRALADRLGVADRVVLTGWVSGADLEGLYAAATCLAYPSEAEGFGLPVLEAMRRGVAVACADASALPEVAGDAALLFDPTSVDAIADAVGRLVGDEALRAELAQRGREQAASFSWERAARETVDVYQRALAR